MTDGLRQRRLKGSRGDHGIGGETGQQRCHVRMNHARAFCHPAHGDDPPTDRRSMGDFFVSGIRRHDGLCGSCVTGFVKESDEARDGLTNDGHGHGTADDSRRSHEDGVGRHA